MSESTERPDADAWAKASAEDTAAEHARRREQAGQGVGSAAEELRRLADAVTDRLAGLRNPAVQLAAQGVISQVRSVVEPIKDRNPDVFDHLTAAGAELLAAYRSAVAQHETRWTGEDRAPSSPTEHIDLD
jgi:ABC-type transporter Mla subunit MlaD